MLLPMSKLHTIVEEANQIPLNLGNPATKMNRIFTACDEWMGTYYPLVKRCGIECTYTPTHVESELVEDSARTLKIEELSTAVSDADSDLSIDLEVVVKMRQILEKAQSWIDKVDDIAPKKDAKKKGKQDKHPLNELSNLIDESSTIIVDVKDELERLRLEQSNTASWRLQAQQTLREIVLAFNNFRKERADICSGGEGANNLASPATSSQGSMTTRNINSRRRSTSVDKADKTTKGPAKASGPAYVGNGGNHLFALVTNFLNSVKAMNILTPEGNIADELNDITSWFTKTFNLMNNMSDIYDRKNFSKLDKLIKSGQKLANYKTKMSEKIPEDPQLLDDLRQSWASAVKDDTTRLLELQSERDRFVEWCEKADEIISSTDKKVPIETLKELEEQSATFPLGKLVSSLLSCLFLSPKLTITLFAFVHVLIASEIVIRVQERAKEANEWVANVAKILKTGKKIPVDEAKAMASAGDKLNITCSEYKTLKAAVKTTKSWLLRVKKSGAENGHAQVAVSIVTDLINEHKDFLVTADDALSDLKQVLCGYCVCRQPYEGFMIGCDGCEEWYHGPCVGISQEQAQKFDKYVCVRCSTLRVYKDNAATVAAILRKWTNAKNLSKARSGDSQRYGRKVRGAERDIVKAKEQLQKNVQALNSILNVKVSASAQPQVAQPQVNGGATSSITFAPVNQGGLSAANAAVTEQNAKLAKSEKGQYCCCFRYIRNDIILALLLLILPHPIILYVTSPSR